MSDIIDALGDALDQQYHEIIVKGEIARDAQGNLILDESGEPVRTTPSAAMMNAAARWYEKRRAGDRATSRDMADLAAAAMSAPRNIQEPDLLDDDDVVNLTSLPRRP